MTDALAFGAKEGLDLGNQAAWLPQLVAATRKDLDREVVALLGEKRFVGLQEYRNTITARIEVSRLKQSLLLAGDGLHRDVEESLIRILAEEDAKVSLNQRPVGSEGLLLITDEGLRRASEILSPSQVVALRDAKRKSEIDRELVQARFDASETVK